MRRCPQCGATYRGAPPTCPIDGATLGAAEHDLAGKTIGAWRVETTLAEGALATVYRATRGEQTGALKVYRAAAPLLRAQRESTLQQQVAHPNVARVLDHGLTDQGRHYLVTEFIHDARPLRALIASPPREGGGQPWREVVPIGREVAAGLAAIHAAGLIHRDLKPENIMVVDGGASDSAGVKILDMGHALALDRQRLTDSGQVWGSAAYMSPEQAAGQDLDHRSDLYALGVVLYELLVGVRPFEAPAAADVMQLHWTTRPRPPANRVTIPVKLDELCLWLLAKRASQRPSSAHVVHAVLDTLVHSNEPGCASGSSEAPLGVSK